MPTETENIVAHTPGPWIVRTEDHNAVRIFSTDDYIVARVFEAHRLGVAEERMANAALIAAAPELLKWAKAFEDMLLREYQQAPSELSSAIAKAEGRES